jgi:hypothetical protein
MTLTFYDCFFCKKCLRIRLVYLFFDYSEDIYSSCKLGQCKYSVMFFWLFRNKNIDTSALQSQQICKLSIINKASQMFPLCTIKCTEYSHHKVLTYKEYRAVSGVFLTIEFVSPPESVSSPRTKGGGVHTRRAVRGWGVNILEDAMQTLVWPLTIQSLYDSHI